MRTDQSPQYRCGVPTSTPGFSADHAQDAEGRLVPPLDVSETDLALKICAELPGVTENELDIQLQDDVLVIRGEKKAERTDKEKSYHYIERSYGNFQLAFRLPGWLNPDQVQARLEHGLLTVTVSKNEQQERSRRIRIEGRSRSGEKTEPNQVEGERGTPAAKGFPAAASPLGGC